MGTIHMYISLLLIMTIKLYIHCMMCFELYNTLFINVYMTIHIYVYTCML